MSPPGGQAQGGRDEMASPGAAPDVVVPPIAAPAEATLLRKLVWIASGAVVGFVVVVALLGNP